MSLYWDLIWIFLKWSQHVCTSIFLSYCFLFCFKIVSSVFNALVNKPKAIFWNLLCVYVNIWMNISHLETFIDTKQTKNWIHTDLGDRLANLLKYKDLTSQESYQSNVKRSNDFMSPSLIYKMINKIYINLGISFKTHIMDVYMIWLLSWNCWFIFYIFLLLFSCQILFIKVLILFSI